MLYMMERLPTRASTPSITGQAFHYRNLVRCIFLPRTMPSLFYNLPITLLLIGNAQNFKTLPPIEISDIWPKHLHLLLPFYLLYFILIALLSLHLSLKLNSSIRPYIVNKSTLDDSGIVPFSLLSCYFIH